MCRSLLLLGICLSSASAEPGVEREIPNPRNFTANDPYMGRTYEERPLVQEVPEILNVTDLLRSTTPIFWKHKTSINQGADVGKLTDIKRDIEAREQEIILEIREVPGILEILDDNKDLEAQIQNFLVLRRAEVKDIQDGIKKLKSDLENVKLAKSTDISDVGGKIQTLYDEIDLHLEEPTSKYNDQYILDRKTKIRRLMQKKKVLKRDYERSEDPKMKSIEKKIGFLEERRKEIHEKSRDLSFEFVKRRIENIEKNNNRINYLVSIHMDRERIRSVKAKMGALDVLKKKLETTNEQISEKSSPALELEADIRFEERYYDIVAKREMEMLEEIRRSREMVHGMRSASVVAGTKVNSSQSQADPGKYVPQAKLSVEQKEAPEHVYVIPMKAGLDLPKVVEIPKILKQRAEEAGSVTPSGIVYVMPMNKAESDSSGAPGQITPSQSMAVEKQLRESNERNLGRILRLEERLVEISEMMTKQTKVLQNLSERPVLRSDPLKNQEMVQQNPVASQLPEPALPQSSQTISKSEDENPDKKMPVSSPSTHDILLQNFQEERNFNNN